MKAEIIPSEPEQDHACEGKSRSLSVGSCLRVITVSSPAIFQQMNVKINDRPMDIPPSSTLLELLKKSELEAIKGIAVAINQTVIPRSVWKDQLVKEHDSITIIQATQGG